MTIQNTPKFSIIIPAYNHGARVADVIKKALALELPVIVVNDGSTDETAEELKKIKGITLLTHQINKGKGAALMTGFKEAAKISNYAITIDGDGQHDPAHAKALMEAIKTGRGKLVVGKRTGMGKAKHIPWTSRFGRKFSNFWVSLSGGPKLSDTQSGFRIYPLPESINLNAKARRFAFEVEILALAKWHNIKIIEVPVGVSYQEKEGRISHFRPFVDFWRNAWAFTRLITGRVLGAKYRAGKR